MSPGLDNVAHVQLVDLVCDECGERFDHRVEGEEIRMANEWTVEVVTRPECPACGYGCRWVIEEELRRESATVG